MQYIPGVIAYSAAMLLIYGLFLRNKPMYQFSRFYLLATAILPFLIPLIKLPESVQHRVQSASPVSLNIPAFTTNAATTASQQIESAKNAVPILWLLYGIVAIVFLAGQLRNAYRLWRVIKDHRVENYGTYKLIRRSGYGPGSFGRYIFFPEGDVNNTILAHEQAHIYLRHTRDIVFLTILQAITWPNLFLIWIRKELIQVHEFQADALANTDKDAYAELLVSSIFNTTCLPVMHSFSIHPVKRRIKMLYKNGTGTPLKSALFITASLTIFLALLLGIQSCSKHTLVQADDSGGFRPIVRFDTLTLNSGNHDIRGGSVDGNAPAANTRTAYKIKDGVIYTKTDTISAQELQQSREKEKADAIPDEQGIYTRVTKMPVPTVRPETLVGENEALQEYSRKNNVGGMVIARFVVGADGNVTNPEVLQCPDAGMSDQVMQLIKTQAKWKPGEENGKKVPVYYTMHLLLYHLNK